MQLFLIHLIQYLIPPTGYTYYRRIEVSFMRYRQTAVVIDDIKLRKLPLSARNIMLRDVVIETTKVKMIVKGDTIVYDASAFQLTNGSMLDALISQLPGAELRDGGQIL